MVTSPDGSASLKLQLLEAQPGNLEAVRTPWPQAAIVARAVGQELDVTDQISREKVQVVYCDLSGSDCPGVRVLQQIRRVHPQQPLVAVLPTQDFAMVLTALRSGVDDLLVHPLSKDVFLAAGKRVSQREVLNARPVEIDGIVDPRSRAIITWTACHLSADCQSGAVGAERLSRGHCPGIFTARQPGCRQTERGRDWAGDLSGYPAADEGRNFSRTRGGGGDFDRSPAAVQGNI